MAIIAREPESKYTPCPEGLYQAVCVDVVDLGLQSTPWGEKPKVRIVWQVEEVNPENDKRFEVRGLYTLSLSEKSNLRKHLEAWRGRKFSPDELRGFDVEKLLGANCQIQIIHNVTDDGKTYANVQAIVPHSPKVPKIAAQDFIRDKDRPKQQTTGGAQSNHGAGHDGDDDDVPF